MNYFLITPAGRLFRFLEHCSIQMLSHNNVFTIEKVWSGHLNVELTTEQVSKLDLHAALAPVLALPAAIRIDVARRKKPIAPLEELLEPLPSAERALSLAGSLGRSIKDVNSCFDRDTLTGLKLLRRNLQQELACPAPSDDQIANLRSAVDLLRDETRAASDLNPRTEGSSI